jgi:hypothetical protein
LEEILDNLWLIIAALFWVLPGLLKFFKKQRGKSAPQPVARPVIEFEEEDVFQGQIVTIPDEVDDVDELAGHADELKELARLSQAILQGAETQMRRCGVIGKSLAKLGGVVQTSLVVPLKEIKKNLEQQVASDRYFSPDEVARIRSDLYGYEQMLEILADMIEDRSRPQWSGLLDKLDIAAQELLTPYLVHARLMEIQYPTEHAVVVVREVDDSLSQKLHAAGIASSRIDEKKAEHPLGWTQLSADIALDVYFSTPGLARRIALDLGVMPPPQSIRHYTNRDSFVAGLVGGWLPRLFADTGATLQLGPGLSAGLTSTLRRGSDAADVVKIYVGDQPRAEELPLHVRMFVACRVLQHLGMKEEAKTRWQDWYVKSGEPVMFTLYNTDGRTTELAAPYVLSAVARVVDYLIDEPQAALGGYPLGAIPGLACDQRSLSDMRKTAARFLEDEPVDAPARVVIGASLLAVESNTLREMRIIKLAMDSLGGAGEKMGVATDSLYGPATGLADILQSREHIARAIVTGGLLAPRNAKNRRILA